MDSPISISTNHFNYKYVTVYQDQILVWENGINRIADLSVLPEVGEQEDSPVYISQYDRPKIVELRDIWEMVIIRFSVFTDEENDEQVYVTKDKQHLAMKRRPRKDGWLMTKYGKDVSPWECRLMVPNTDPRYDLFKLEYQYQIKTQSQNHVERIPQRAIEILDPASYDGQLCYQGTTEQYNTDRVFLVNGFLDKCDANFLRQFKVSKISDSGIFIGPYPQEE